MKKRPQKSRKIGSASASEFRIEKRTPRGLKGPKQKRVLPPWREIKDTLK